MEMKLDLDLERLSVTERLDLLEQIWDSLSKNPDQIPLTAAQRAELDRRIDQAEADGGQGISWQQLQDRIRARR